MARGRLGAAELRTGGCSPRRLWLRARLGDQAAVAALGADAPPPCEDVLDGLDAVLGEEGARGGVAAALTALRLAGVRALPSRWQALLEALERWCEAPELSRADAIKRALPPRREVEDDLQRFLFELGAAACGGNTGVAFLATWRATSSQVLPRALARGALLGGLDTVLGPGASADELALEEDAAHLRRRVGLGQVGADDVLLAAFAGDPVSRAALKGVRSFDDPPLAEWLLGIRELDRTSSLHAVVMIARRALPHLLARWPQNTAPLRAIHYMEQRLLGDLVHSECLPLRTLRETCFRGPPVVRSAARTVFLAALLWFLLEPVTEEGLRGRKRSRSDPVPTAVAIERAPLGRNSFVVIRQPHGEQPSYDLPWGRGLEREAAIRSILERFAAEVPAVVRDEEVLRAQVAARLAQRALHRRAWPQHANVVVNP